MWEITLATQSSSADRQDHVPEGDFADNIEERHFAIGASDFIQT
jgi:hypothetical protein